MFLSEVKIVDWANIMTQKIVKKGYNQFPITLIFKQL